MQKVEGWRKGGGGGVSGAKVRRLFRIHLLARGQRAFDS